MAVSKRLRYEVLRRDNHTCRYCGRSAPDVELHVDHVTPVALGGTDTPDNLVTSCADCNGGKSSATADAEVVDDVRQNAHKWAAAMQEAAAIAAATETARDAYIDTVEDAWLYYRQRIPRGLSNSIGAFYDAGLPVEVCVSMVDVTFSAYGIEDRVAYFAGCCWKRIRQMQQIAQDLLAAEDAD